MSKPRRHARRSQSEWVELLNRFKSTGLPVREFCRPEGVSPSSFQRWRARLGSVRPAGFVELVPSKPDPVEVAAQWSLDVALPNGVQLRFRG